MTTPPPGTPTTRTTATFTLVAMAGIAIPMFLRSSDDFARWLIAVTLLGMAAAISLTFRRRALPLTGDGAARTSRLLLLETLLIAVLAVTGFVDTTGPGTIAISVAQLAVAVIVAAGAARLFRYSRVAAPDPTS